MLKRKPKKPADAVENEKLVSSTSNTNNNNSNRNAANPITNNSSNSKLNTPPKKPPVKLEDFVKKLPNRDSPTSKQQLFPKPNNNNDAFEESPSKKRKDNSTENLTSPKKIKGPMDDFVNNAKSPTKTNSNNGRAHLLDEEIQKDMTNLKHKQQMGREKEEEWNPQFELGGEDLHTQRVNRSGTRGFRAPEILLRVR